MGLEITCHGLKRRSVSQLSQVSLFLIQRQQGCASVSITPCLGMDDTLKELAELSQILYPSNSQVFNSLRVLSS